MVTLSEGISVQQIPLVVSGDDGAEAYGIITYTGHPTGSLDVQKSFQIGNHTYIFCGSAVPFNSNTDTIWTSMVAAINASTSAFSASIDTVLDQVTITYRSKGSIGNNIVFSNDNVQNVTFSGSGFLANGVDAAAFPVTKTYELSLDGRYASVSLYEAIGTQYVLVKEDDPRIGDVAVFDSSDSSPSLRISFNSDFSGHAVVIGGIGETFDVSARLEDLEVATNTLIGAANSKLAKTEPVNTAIMITNKNLASLETRVTNIETTLQQILRQLNIIARI